MTKKKAIYPGSFDPITNGHIDIIKRSIKYFDSIIVAVLENPKKTPLFSTKERVDMIRKIFPDEERVEIQSFDGLLVNFARFNKVGVVIRGLRAISDFEYEFQMALMNATLAPEIETFFLMPNIKFSFLSSNLIKEVVMLGGSVKDFVPPLVARQLEKKLTRKNLLKKLNIKAG